jgi:FlaA1/EpsC-like NDP-sugar epimerase
MVSHTEGASKAEAKTMRSRETAASRSPQAQRQPGADLPRRPSLLEAVKRLRRLEGWSRALMLVAGDAAAAALALYLAYLIRFEGLIPRERVAQLVLCLPVLLGIRVAVGLAFGLHRWSFRLSGLHEGLRVVKASLVGSGLFTALYYFAQRAAEDVSLGPPRSVILIEFLLTTTFVGASRFSLRVAEAWGMNLFRPHVGEWLQTVIVGAGSAGDLLLRDLQRSDEHSYHVIGFVDDKPAKRGTTIGGRQVLGSLDELPEVCRRWHVQQVLFAIPRLAPERLRQVLDSCAELGLSYKSVPVSFAYLNDRLSAATLQDLAAEDLLRRSPVRFESDLIRPHVAGKRILVTGAAGSIGGEACRQVAACGPASLVLADINENGLYMLYRSLRRSHPGLPVVVEVVDIRDAVRLRQLGEEHRPERILHAAAHKHVPLMERNPEEAIKNNVLGCRNVVRMAEAVAAERFVFISTDKAVEPASVMGATKQLAELLVRHRDRRSATRFSVVRFGNVLGSAGSVVPLFKQQIARGGPVTVTHPDCTRFLMTIREAVGLVLIAGLGGDDDLYVLEMGEPIRVLELARLMITLAGRVPERDVAITFTGLRPGEKLHERLMTEAEARSARSFCDGIRAVDGATPPADIEERIDALGVAAAAADRGRIVELLRGLVLGYVPSPLGGTQRVSGTQHSGEPQPSGPERRSS